MATLRSENGESKGLFEKPSASCFEEMKQDNSRTNLKETEEMGKKAFTGQSQGRESWEHDSGTHDMNCEPSIQQIMAAANNAKGPSRSSNFLELANTVSEVSDFVIYVVILTIFRSRHHTELVCFGLVVIYSSQHGFRYDTQKEFSVNPKYKVRLVAKIDKVSWQLMKSGP